MPTVVTIDDLDDPRLDVFRDVRDKDLRGHHGMFMAESELVVRRLLRTPERLSALLLSPVRRAALAPALDALPADVPVYVADVEVMTLVAGFHIHRGVLAAGRRPSAAEVSLEGALGHLRPESGGGPLCLLLAEGIVNVDNMGALFRNAAAFGAAGVVLDPTSCDPLYRKAIRVSMGHVLSTPWAVCRRWPEDLETLKRTWGIRLIGAEVAPEARPLWDAPAAERVGYLFGSEGHGLSPEARAACDELAEIPMSGAPSINVAVSSAVFLYERARRRHEAGSRTSNGDPNDR